MSKKKLERLARLSESLAHTLGVDGMIQEICSKDLSYEL